MSFYSDMRSNYTTSFGLAIGAAYALTIIATLEICIALYEPANFSTFNFVATVGGIAGVIMFRNQRHYAVENSSLMIHFFGSIMRLWGQTFFVVALSLYLTKTAADFSRVVMTMWLVATPLTLTLTSLLCRWCAQRLYSARRHQRSAVFVGFSEEAQQLSSSFQKLKMLGITPLGFFDNDHDRQAVGSTLPRLGSLMDAVIWIKHNPVDVVFVALTQTDSSDISPVVDALHDSVASVYFVPDSTVFGLSNLQYNEIDGTPVLVAYDTPFVGTARLLKRLTDVILSTLILLMLSPILMFIAICVKATSPGPVLFRQLRYGAGGQPIVVTKFRSMYNNPLPQNGEIKQATVGDARVTPLGHFLRRTSLDELPQFINVIAGSMSIVGPRPHAVQHNELYRTKVKGYMLRHKVKPGITGWAQVNGLRGETDTLEKMQRRIEYDLYYIRHWSLALDLKIIMRTVLVVFYDINAY